MGIDGGQRRYAIVKTIHHSFQHTSSIPFCFAETAVNIGYSCQLLSDDLLDLFVVDGSTMDEVEKQLLKYRDAIKAMNAFQPPSKNSLDDFSIVTVNNKRF